MRLKLGNFEFNVPALLITGCLLLNQYLRFVFYAFDPELYPLRLVPLTVELIIGAIVGWNASGLFGGRKNFTGKLLCLFSVGLFAGAIAFFVGMLETFQLLNGFYLEVLLYNSGIGSDGWLGFLWQCFPTYVLLVSARSIWNKFDSKSLIVMIISSAFVLLVSWTNFVFDPTFGLTTVPDFILWVGLYPILELVQLTAGVFMLRSLGDWYVSKRIAVVVSAFLFYGAFYQFWSSIGYLWINQAFGGGISLTGAASVIYGFGVSLSLYVVCMTLTQIKPRTTGRYY